MMTRPDDGHAIGQLFGSLVPDLPDPSDRLAAVGRRARRNRVRQTVLVAACVLLVLIGAPALVAAARSGTIDRAAGPHGPDAGDCPEEGPRFERGNGVLPPTAP